jgi:subtilase family serine protease
LRQARLKALKFAADGKSQLPSSQHCLATYGVPCYSPQDIRKAYGIAPLIEDGFRGAGQTIVVIVSYGSPTIEADLQAFDSAFGLPPPPSLRVIAPLGTVPFDPNDTDQLGWAGETSLDVEWAHALAPEANIVVLTSPIDETQGVQGLPEFLQLEQYAVEHHLGNIITQSWGTAENTLFTTAGYQVLNDFEKFYQSAANERITILAAAGDTGTANIDLNGNPYPFPTVDFPASSPYVTAVGGTTLLLDNNGNYASETVWDGATGASGGGVSQYFTEPLFQLALPKGIQKTIARRRGIPDVTLVADPNTPLWVYFGFFPDPSDNGFYFSGGTSDSAPQWAGIIADANQLAREPLGFLNPALYALGAVHEQNVFFHDITVGNNAFGGLAGYSAAPGWDPASGWGTPNFGELIWHLRP